MECDLLFLSPSLRLSSLILACMFRLHLLGTLVQVVLIAYGVVLVFRVNRTFKNLKSSQADFNIGNNMNVFNESKTIGYCLYNVCFLLILLVPIIISLADSQWRLKLVLVTIAMFASSQFNAVFLFLYVTRWLMILYQVG